MTCMYSSVWESMAMWLLGEDCPPTIIPVAAIQPQTNSTSQRSLTNYEYSNSEDPGPKKLNCIRLDAPKWRNGCLFPPTYIRSVRMQCAMALSSLNIFWLAILSFSDCRLIFRYFAQVSRTMYLHAKHHRHPLIWQIITQ